MDDMDNTQKVSSKKSKKNRRNADRKKRQKEREKEEEEESKTDNNELNKKNEQNKINSEENNINEEKKDNKNNEDKKETNDNNNTSNEVKKEKKYYDKDTKLLLYLSSMSNYMIEHLKKKNINEFIGNYSKKGLVGLKNLGNTCFMNSAIQCLSNCELLTKFLLSPYYDKFREKINCTSKYSSGGAIANSYSNLLKELWGESKSYISPYGFYKTFISYVKIFDDYSQHDSHEMLIYLLEKLHEDLNRNNEKKYIELNEKQPEENDIDASNRWWEAYLRRDNSIIMDLFSGQYKSTLRCPFCDKISITYDQFSCLELPIEDKCFSGTSYVINEKENTIRKINLIFGEDEKFRDICDKINCQKTYKAILCRNSKMYLANLQENHNLYELIKQCHDLKKEFKDRIIFYEYEKNELDNRLIFFVVPIVYLSETDPASGSEEKKEHYLFFPKIFNYSPSDKVQDFYNDLKKYYHKYYKEKDSNFSDDKIKLRIVNNLTACTKTHDPCDYCKSKECVSCEFKFGKDMTMGELQGTQSKKRSFVMYLDIPKENFENEDYDSIKLYDNYLNDEEDFILSNELTLENCFNSFSRCEKLDETNEWYCPKCKEHRRGYKQLEIFRLPKYLILELKRFKNQFGFFFNSKNSTYVKFPLEDLDLNKFLVGPKNKDYIYDLIGVSQHWGASFGGHYTSVCKKENIWYEFDDEDVSRTDENKIVNSNAYVLIYELKE